MRFGLSGFRAMPLFDVEGGGGAGAPAGGDSGAGTPAAPTGGTPAGQPSGAPSGTPNPGSGTPSGGAKQFSYAEDRSNWVPSHRLRETTEQYRARQAQLERDLHYERQRVAALSGVSMPKPPANPEHEQIRQQLFEIFPQLKQLVDLDPEKLGKVTGFDFEALQKAQNEITERTWQNHGTRAAQAFEAKAAELYGDVTPKRLQRMLSAFVAEAQADDQMRARYEAGDFTVIDEFLQDWSKEFVEPIRKAATTPTPGQIAARRLPRGGGSSAVTAPRPSTLKPADGEKFHNAAFEAFQRAR